MEAKTYAGMIDPVTDNAVVTATYTDDKPHLPLTYEIEHHVKHSPTGFAWGYNGSGPAELARCILWDLYGTEPPAMVYQPFKEAFIAKLPMDQFWQLTSTEIEDWIDEYHGVSLDFRRVKDKEEE